jgi:hypothetical protein
VTCVLSVSAWSRSAVSDRIPVIVERYSGMLEQLKGNRERADHLVQLKMLMQIGGITWEEHVRLAEAAGVSDDMLTDRQGHSFRSWWQHRDGRRRQECRQCGASVFSGASRCFHCQAQLVPGRTAPAVVISPENAKRWKGLPGNRTGTGAVMLALGALLAIAALLVCIGGWATRLHL